MAPDPVRAALYTYLAADDPLTGLLSDPSAIFNAKAPQGTEPPYVIFNLMAGTEIWTFGEGFQEAVWLVKGVCRGDSATKAEEIDARCKALLHKVQIGIPGGHLTALRESAVSYGSDADGVSWWHRGGQYRLFHP